MRANRMVAKTWGTWYTDDGDRADGWPAEGRPQSAPAPREALVGTGKHNLAAGGDGLAGAFTSLRASNGPLAGLL